MPYFYAIFSTGCVAVFDFPGKKLYIGLLVLGVIDIVWLIAGGHSVDMNSLRQPAVTVSLLLVGNVLYAIGFRVNKDGKTLITSPWILQNAPRLEAFFQGMYFLVLGWLTLRLFNHLSMTVPIPYADGFLQRYDENLLLDWNAYFELVANSPTLVYWLDQAYSGLTPISILAFLGLIAMNRVEQARFFVTTFTVTAIICAVIGMFFPALGTVVYVLNDQSLIQNFSKTPGSYWIEILENLRSGNAIVFDMTHLPGLTTFPSFHTASGIILAYAFWGSRLYWPVIIYTVVMIASTPIYGGHYFVDLIFGSAIAYGVCRYYAWSASPFREFNGSIQPAE